MTSLWQRSRFRRDHRWTPGHISAYLDNDLAARARARLERHVADCPECRRILHTMRRMLGLLGGASAQTPGEAPDITAAVIRRLGEQARE